MIGNLHAVHMTCTNTGHQNRIQQALLSVLHSDELDYRVGTPLDMWTARNRQVAKRTLLQRFEFVADGMRDEDSFATSVDKCLLFWNGDWTQGRPSHYCSG